MELGGHSLCLSVWSPILKPIKTATEKGVLFNVVTLGRGTSRFSECPQVRPQCSEVRLKFNRELL